MEILVWMIPGAVIGLLLGFTLQKIFARKWLPLASMVVVMAIAANAPLLFKSAENPPVAPGTDAAAEILLNDFASKSPAYRVLADEDGDFRRQWLALFKSIAHPPPVSDSNPSEDLDEIDRLNPGFKAKLTSLSTEVTNKYMPYADDEKMVVHMLAVTKVADYFSRHAPDGCRGIFSGNVAHFSELPPDLMAGLRGALSDTLISGFRNFKAGKGKGDSFTPNEFQAFLDGETKNNPNFRQEDLFKLYEPAEKTTAQDICLGIHALSVAGAGETPQMLGKFYRTVQFGTK